MGGSDALGRTQLDGMPKVQRTMEQRLAHILPRAPQFVGREAELDELRSWLSAGGRGVFALVGLGGAGKTAIAARLLDDLSGLDLPSRPDRLFVWSFYLEPDVSVFLDQAFHFFAGSQHAEAPAKGGGLLHLLRKAPQSGGRNLMVLDGLERVQREEGHHSGAFGQLEDPLLRGLLSHRGGCRPDGRAGYQPFPSDRPRADARAGLPSPGRHGAHADGGRRLATPPWSARRRGMLGSLVESYGAHALSLDHLGSLIGQFLDGDPSRAPEAQAQLAAAGPTGTSPGPLAPGL